MKTQTKEMPSNLKVAGPVGDLPAVIVVSAEAWSKYRTAEAKAKAAEKEAKALKMELGFPDTEALVSLLKPTPSKPVSAVIQDGNGTPVGNVSVFHRDAYRVAAGFVSRIS